MLHTDRTRQPCAGERFHTPLREVTEPELFRDVFPYTQPPRVAFHHGAAPRHVPDEVWITDTTFRDGQQARPPLTVEQIVHLYGLLHRLGGPRGKVRQSEFFLYSEKDQQAVEACLARGYRYPEITGWIRARADDFRPVKLRLCDTLGYGVTYLGAALPRSVQRLVQTTRAGIHADGLAKDEELYSIFDTTTLLRRPPSVAVTDKSGTAGIAHWIRTRLGVEVDKSHPAVARIREAVQLQYDAGRTTAISDREMTELASAHLRDPASAGAAG